MPKRKSRRQFELSERVRVLVLEAGSEYALARRLGDPARFKGQVSRWLSGKSGINAEGIRALCAACGVSSDWLLGLSDSRQHLGQDRTPQDLANDVSAFVGRSLHASATAAKQPPPWLAELARLQVDGDALLEDMAADQYRRLDEAWAQSAAVEEVARLAMRNMLFSWLVASPKDRTKAVRLTPTRMRAVDSQMESARGTIERLAKEVRKSEFHRLIGRGAVSQVAATGSRRARREGKLSGNALADLGLVVRKLPSGLSIKLKSPAVPG